MNGDSPAAQEPLEMGRDKVLIAMSTLSLKPNASEKGASHAVPSLVASPRPMAIAAVFLLLLRLLLGTHLGLTEDEAYYRLWSLAPSLSFLDHPPMVAWLIACGRAIAGDSEIGIRLLAPALLLLGTILQWYTTSVLFDRPTADIAALLFISMPLLNVGGIIITPDMPSVLFYGLCVLGLAQVQRTQNANWWLAIGLFAGCGLLSKYTNLFIGITIFAWLIAVPSHRRWLRVRQFWMGGLIAALMFSPVLMWNTDNGWASFVKQFGRIGDHGSTGLAYLLELAGGLLLLMGPVTAVLAMMGLYITVQRASRNRDSADALVAATVLPPLAYFLLHALHGRVQANWLAPLYPMLAVCAAIAITSSAPKSRGRLTLAAFLTGLAITAVIYVHAFSPIVTLRRDATGQMRGWSEFAKPVLALAIANDAGWIATSHYGTTGELSYVLRHAYPVAQLNERIRHQHLPQLPDPIVRRPAIYVELDRRSSEELLGQCFDQFNRIATIIRDDLTTSGASYAVYLAKGFKSGCAGADTNPTAGR